MWKVFIHILLWYGNDVTINCFDWFSGIKNADWNFIQKRCVRWDLGVEVVSPWVTPTGLFSWRSCIFARTVTAFTSDVIGSVFVNNSFALVGIGFLLFFFSPEMKWQFTWRRKFDIFHWTLALNVLNTMMIGCLPLAAWHMGQMISAKYCVAFTSVVTVTLTFSCNNFATSMLNFPFRLLTALETSPLKFLSAVVVSIWPLCCITCFAASSSMGSEQIQYFWFSSFT